MRRMFQIVSAAGAVAAALSLGSNAFATPTDIANYTTAFPGAAGSGWSFSWNANGAISGDPSTYTPLTFDAGTQSYSAGGNALAGGMFIGKSRRERRRVELNLREGLRFAHGSPVPIRRQGDRGSRYFGSTHERR